MSERRATFLKLTSQIESQLRDAYAARHEHGMVLADIANRLGVSRETVRRWLTGRADLSVSQIADLIWALDCDVRVTITPQHGERNESFPKQNKPY